MRNLGRLIIILFIAYPLGMLSAQGKKISKIITPNLFLLEDGSAVKMAGVSIPEYEDSTAALKGFISQVMQFSNEYLLARRFEIIRASDSAFVDKVRDIKYYLAYITKHYPLSSTDVNLKYLEMGYGRFRNNVDDIHRKAYIEAEKSAYEQGEGIWNYADKKPYDNNFRKYNSKILWNDSAEDSVYIRSVPLIKKSSLCKLVLGELLMGSLFIPIGVVGGAVVGYGLEEAVLTEHDEYTVIGGVLIGGYVGAVIGSSLGIYLVAHNNNPRITFYNTLSAGLIGAAVGVGFCSTNKENFRRYGLTVAVLPVLLPIIYVNIVKGDYNYSQSSAIPQHQWNYDAGSMSFKDIRNRDVMNVNIFHLSF